jgi:integrase
LRRERRTTDGKLKENARWVILDTGYEGSTGCGPHDRIGAERALSAYIGRKHVTTVSIDERDPSEVPVADTLALYARDVAKNHVRPKATAQIINDLLDFFGDDTLVDLNGERCREFASACSTDSVARHKLEVLRAAINHHRKEGHCSKLVSVVLPPPRPARERWLTRSEAAQAIWAAWRYREVQKGFETDKRPRRHTAKFMLVALYTGSRSGVICDAALEKTEGHGWIDTGSGIFYRKPPRRRRAAAIKRSKKRAPTIRLPDRLLAHLRRWKAQGQKFVVEYEGEPILRITKSHDAAVGPKANGGAGLGDDVTPHTWRHTCATWLMQAKTDPWVAAGFLGMTVETLLENYGHHHPDFQEGARTAFARLRLVS